MDVQEAYNSWSAQYDTNINKTRDLEAQALRSVLKERTFSACLEIGCGTGKNTLWLKDKAAEITAVDLSPEMLAKARGKISADHVKFVQADITQRWNFGIAYFDLVGFSLVLEHIENLGDIFAEASAALKPGGYVYVGELHPFKQYSGSKARFATETGEELVTCFTHHLSEFTQSAKKAGLGVEAIEEWFDDEDRSGLPRILTALFKKQ